MLKILERLRPAAETAAALGESITRTEAAVAEAEARIGDLQAGRGAALLAGGQTAERHEAALREARDDAERLTALRDALRTRHAEAERRERRQKLEAQAAAAAQAAKAAGERIAREYSALAAKLAALLAAERDAIRAVEGLMHDLAAAPPEAAEGIALPPTPRTYYGRAGHGMETPLSAAVRLPRQDDPNLGGIGGAMLWPAAG